MYDLVNTVSWLLVMCWYLVGVELLVKQGQHVFALLPLFFM